MKLRQALEWIGRKLTRKAIRSAETAGVFISYAHEDEQTTNSLVSDLEERGIKTVWFAPKQLGPGDHLDSKIRKAIDQAVYFLVAVTQHSNNSRWVAKEVEYAKQREKETNLRLIPLYLKSRDAPESLRDYLAIDIREYVYKAGFEDLVDVLRGKLIRGRTPLSKFEQFIDSLPIVDEEVESVLASIRRERFRLGMLRNHLKDISGLRADECAGYRQEVEPKLVKDLQNGETLLNQNLQHAETLLDQKGLSSADRKRIMGVLNSGGGIPPCLLLSELQDIRIWLRSGTPATLAVASSLYYWRFLIHPSVVRIRKSDFIGQVNRWVRLGEISQLEAPDPDWLIQRLIEEKIIRPFARREYVHEPTDESQEFHEGALYRSVGKAAYLFEINDPDRPTDEYPIGRFPGSTPKGVFA